MQVDDWGVGKRIAVHRKRRGMTQEQLAGLVGISLSLMKKIESGVRPVTKFSLLVRFAQALRIKDMRDLTGVPLPMVADGVHGHAMANDVRAAMMEYALRPKEEPHLGHLAQEIEAAWDAWQSPSPWRYARVGQALPTLIRGTRNAVSLSEGTDRRRALAETTKLYQLVRTWTKRVGEHELSWLAADRAMTAAIEIDDPSFIGSSAWNLAMILSAKGHTENASAVAARAIDDMSASMAGASDGKLAVWGGLHLLAATEAARADRAADADRLLAAASPIADALGETNHFRIVFGPTNVDLHRLSTLVELGRTRDALNYAERIDITSALAVERRLTYYLDSARCYARLGSDLSAIHMLKRMHSESPEELYYNSIARETLRSLAHRAKRSMRGDLDPLLSAAGLPD